MPFDTVEHTHKRLRYDGSWEDPEDAGYQFIPSQPPQPSHFWDSPNLDIHARSSSSSLLDWQTNTLNGYLDPYHKNNADYSIPIRERKISIPSQFSTSPISDHDVLTSPTFYTTSLTTTSTTCSQQQDIDGTTTKSSFSSDIEYSRVHDILSKCSVSYTTTGMNVEAKVTNATELRSLIDTFSKLCPSMPTTNANDNDSTPLQPTMSPLSTSKGIALYRNKLHKSKPVNFFDSVCNLSHLLRSSSIKSTTLSLRQIGDACMETYFDCWVRYSPIIDKKEFMAWYQAAPNPMETLIVNAICSLVFSHTVNHHAQPGLENFKHDQELVLQQQNSFFDRARKYLEMTFDTPDRWTVVALLFMSCTAKPDRRHHYSGMATSALLDLEIYPRMVDDQDDSFEKEMDTRLWWFAWSLDFYLYSTGVPRNTPRTNRKGLVDMPRICEEDIDEVEHGVLADIHCLKWWRFQSDVIAEVYEQDNNMTEEQLQQYDDQLLQMYNELPDYLQSDSGFSYGCEDLLMVCVRVNVEFNATRIILHMPFLPDSTNLHPTSTALQSLNICLKTALVQLRTIGSCNKDGRRCAFDRDELWRASEIISLSMDVYRNCDPVTNRELLLQGIDMDEYTLGLQNAMAIMQASSEFKIGRKDWVQVTDWLKDEMARHRQQDILVAPVVQIGTNHQHFSTSSGTTRDAMDGMMTRIKMEPDTTSWLSSSSSSNESAFSTMSIPSVSSSPPSIKTPSSSLSSSVEFIAFCPDAKRLTSSTKKQQPQQRQQPAARFRYFNPRMMNKFLFIDDHPLL
ncbi:hypothetical protein BCR42DRAFT_384744 [Absidia repens]|uniref:Xylanolytic transcriptional activator regulatory domain-containing protein n=1 Tax=Absidia repens TaxID=90262 RepID=A0A1X2HY40_9FUNG|nr:hypothetical protein BCR42DRAFT_384744 [Absidia repens]